MTKKLGIKRLVRRVVIAASAAPKLLQYLSEGGHDFAYYSSEVAETKERDRILQEQLTGIPRMTPKAARIFAFFRAFRKADARWGRLSVLGQHEMWPSGRIGDFFWHPRAPLSSVVAGSTTIERLTLARAAASAAALQ